MCDKNFKYNDYYKITSPHYNELRLDKETEINRTCSILKRYIKPEDGLVLDIGCGTGRYSIYLKRLGFNVTGVDISLDQLAQVSDSIPVHCVSATELPFEDGKFLCCLFILSIHQMDISERKKALKEAVRVLRTGGFLIIKTCSHKDLHMRPLNNEFPSALKINLKRYPDIQLLEEEIKTFGIKIIDIIPTITEQEFQSEQLLYSLKNKHNTTLALIPENEFEEGYAIIETKLKYQRAVKLSHYHTIIVGCKN